MKSFNDKKWLVTLLALMAVFCASIANAVTYDLKSDWINASNPNGSWAFYQGITLLPYQSDYDKYHIYVADQQAWANAQFDPTVDYNNVGHVPVWMKASKDSVWGSGSDVLAGDIILHPSYDGSTQSPYGEGNVTWTSNLTGTATIHGNVWYTGVLDRSDDWNLYLGTTELAGGTVYYNDGHPRSNPYTFGDFIVSVNPGDVLTFTAFGTNGGVPYFLGVNLTIDVTPAAVPLPPSLMLLGSGLLGLTGWRRIRKG
jgi:hypothetical protein